MQKFREALGEQEAPKTMFGVSNIKKLMLSVYVMELEGYSITCISDQILKQYGVEIDEEEINSIVSALDFETWLATKEVKTEANHAS
jgi:hypothetical protein